MPFGIGKSKKKKSQQGAAAAAKAPTLDEEARKRRIERMAQGLPPDEESWSASSSDEENGDASDTSTASSRRSTVSKYSEDNGRLPPEFGSSKADKIASKIITQFDKDDSQKTLDLSNWKVRFNGQSLHSLPVDCWNQFSAKLQVLKLSGHRISVLPEQLALCSSLKVLSISKNAFRSFPSVIFKLKFLQHLDVSENSIGSVDSQLTELKHLRILNMSQCKLSNDCVDLICSLPRIRKLYIGGNSEINNIKPLMICSSLEILEAPACGIESIPNTVCNLINLKELNLSRNKLTDLPNSLGRLGHLNKINIKGNLFKGTFKDIEHFDDKIVSALQARAEGKKSEFETIRASSGLG